MGKLSIWIENALLADQMEVLRGLSRGFPANPEAPETHRGITSFALVTGFIILIWLLSRIAQRQSKPQTCNNPKLLFRSLCQAHRLSRHQCRLLWQLAKYRRLEHPAALFLDPRLFDPSDLPPGLRERAAQLRDLAARLFACRNETDCADATAPAAVHGVAQALTS